MGGGPAARGHLSSDPSGVSASGRVPQGEVVERFHEEGDGDAARPVYAKIMVCWDEDRDAAREAALRWWPVGGVGTAGADLRLPEDFQSVAENPDEGAALAAVLVTDDLDEIAAAAGAFAEAGVTHLALHQVGPDQEPFLKRAADAFLTR